jgi:TRAP-type mannitol/chloroaromatic compound transport system permease small subunit
LSLIVLVDVILRYVFNKPTTWAWDVNLQLLAVLALLGAGYCLLHEAHVRMDIVWVRLPVRGKAILNSITYLLFLFTISMLFWLSVSAASLSVQTGERYSSYLAPPIYPLKIVIAIGLLLLLLQGISKLVGEILIFLRRD